MDLVDALFCVQTGLSKEMCGGEARGWEEEKKGPWNQYKELNKRWQVKTGRGLCVTEHSVDSTALFPVSVLSLSHLIFMLFYFFYYKFCLRNKSD